MESKLIDFQRHLRREFLWKKLLYGPTPGKTEAEVSMVAHCDGLLVVATLEGSKGESEVDDGHFRFTIMLFYSLT